MHYTPGAVKDAAGSGYPHLGNGLVSEKHKQEKAGQ